MKRLVASSTFLGVLCTAVGACSGSGPNEGSSSGTTGDASTSNSGSSSSSNSSTTGDASSSTSGSSTSGDTGTASGTTGGACPPDLIQCGPDCVDTQTDPAHCGACNNPCGDFELCQAGVCEPDTVVAEVVASYAHTCIRTVTGRVRCWGRNANGQLGLGHNNDIGDDELPSTALDVDLGGTPALQIASGEWHTCALLEGGDVRCWGENGSFQLGFGGPDINAPDPNLNVQNVSGAVAIAAGTRHNCALIAGGSVRCWGRNNYGQLGYGHTSDTVAMGDVDVGGTVTALALGAFHTCALLDSGDVRCWGSGPLGHANNAFSTVGNDEVPADGPIVALGAPAAAIASGSEHACALLQDEVRVRCWGISYEGQLGYGNTDTIGDNETPEDVGDVMLSPNAGSTKIVQLESGPGGHTCVVFEDGAMQCWGQNYYGELGYGMFGHVGDDETPADVGLLMAPFPEIVSVGRNHTCLLDTAGDLRCWGWGAFGMLGYGNTMDYGGSPGEAPDAQAIIDIFP